MGNVEVAEGDATPAEEAESEDADENEGEGNETPTEDAIVWPAPPNGSMPTLHSPAPRRRMDGDASGRQLHSADSNGAGPSGSGGAGNTPRGLYPHEYPRGGAGPSGSPLSSRQRPRPAARTTQQHYQLPRASSTSRSPDPPRADQPSGRGGIGGRRFWGAPSPSTSRNNGPQQQQGVTGQLDSDMASNGSSGAGPSSPTMTVRPSGRRMSGSAGGSSSPSRSSPAPMGPRGPSGGSSSANAITHGPVRQAPSPSRRSPASNAIQPHETMTERQSQSQFTQVNLPPTRLQELLAGLGPGPGPGPGALHPSQIIETPTGPMERGPARRAAAEAAIARFEAFNATRRTVEGYVIDAGESTSTTSLPHAPMGRANGNTNTGGWEDNPTRGALVEMDQVLSNTFRSNRSHVTGASAASVNGRGRALRDDANAAGSSGGADGNGMSNGNDGGAGRRGPTGGLHQFTSLFKRTPDH